MIKRAISAELHQLMKEYPVVTVLGPRQAGKTTLCKMEFPTSVYRSLENPETRSFAQFDPKGFLNELLRTAKGPILLDEVQRLPDLLSYIQGIVDEDSKPGRFLLTGSHQLDLRASLTQSLAGRTALLELLPLTVSELAAAGHQFEEFAEYVHHGFLPRIYDQKQRPFSAYSNYFQTYVERDVRQLIQVKDLSVFEKFIRIFAGRVGQLLNLQSIASDVGVDQKTIKQWLSVLEASYIIFRMPPYFENFGKRFVKSSKYYFVEVGLLAFLLGIESPHQVSRDPLRGLIFENLVVIELLKARLNAGKPPQLYFLRDSKGFEIDVLFASGRALHAIEIKASETFSTSLIESLQQAARLSPNFTQATLLYGGEGRQEPLQKIRANCELRVENYKNAAKILGE